MYCPVTFVFQGSGKELTVRMQADNVRQLRNAIAEARSKSGVGSPGDGMLVIADANGGETAIDLMRVDYFTVTPR